MSSQRNSQTPNVNGIALFLDRDGTINTEVDFLRHPDDLRLIPGAAQSIREARSAGLKVIIFTNQSGIARGLLTEDDLERVHERLRSLLTAEGAGADAIYYCPHHPTLGSPKYSLDCDCRKPKPGMLRRAAREHGLDLERSFVVGDRSVDMEAGRAAGCRTILVLTGYGSTERSECEERLIVDHVSPDVHHAWSYVQNRLRRGLDHNI